MAIITCKNCGKKYSDKIPDGCPNCKPNEVTTTPAQINTSSTIKPQIPCPLCSKTMHPSTIPIIHDGAVRFFGWLAIASAIIGVIMFLKYISHNNELLAEIYLGSAFSSAMVGCIILSTRPVWLCKNCNHYQPRHQ